MNAGSVTLPCFVPSTSVGSSSFAPHALVQSSRRRAFRARPRLSDSRRPRMLFGRPRVIAPSTRPDASESSPVVQVPPSRPSLLPTGAVSWSRAHPFQSALAISVVFVALRRFLQRKASLQSGDNSKSSRRASGSASVTKVDVNLPTRTPLRAVPKPHESTAEALDLLSNTARKYIIVGGKGGVGKTSMSASIATAFADRGQTTLIISTDPAHSLSDSFGQSVSGGDPVPVSSVDNLYAQEVDPNSMKKTFKMMSNMDGVGALGVDDMGLDELNSLFDTIPPGFDEAVALVEIVKYIEGDAQYARFDRIVFDTAPTGHTLRLLALPDFLNGFFGKIISMKSKFGNVMSQFKGMFGNDVDIDNSVEEMEELKRSMTMVRQLFRDEVQTEFIVATIPNMMAIAESKRLVDELRKERIPVRHLFVNQLQPSNDECTFCAARFKEQSANMAYLKREMADLQLSTVQSFDKEIKGSSALRAMAGQLFPDFVPPTSVEGADGSAGTRTDVPSSAVKRDDSPPEPKIAKAELVE